MDDGGGFDYAPGAGILRLRVFRDRPCAPWRSCNQKCARVTGSSMSGIPERSILVFPLAIPLPLRWALSALCGFSLRSLYYSSVDSLRGATNFMRPWALILEQLSGERQ